MEIWTTRTSPLFEDHQAGPGADLARTYSATAAAVDRIAQEGGMAVFPGTLVAEPEVPISVLDSAGLHAQSAPVSRSSD